MAKIDLKFVYFALESTTECPEKQLKPFAQISNTLKALNLFKSILTLT